MNITKIGHCCFYIKENGIGILTDPGAWTSEQNSLTGISIIIITHEHADHFHIESLKQVLANNPKAIVITNSSVEKLLQEQGIACVVIENGEEKTIAGVSVSGHGAEHAVIYPTIPIVMNTGYLIAKRFFLPGDALIHPGVPVEILGLPVAGPWMKISDAIDWALMIKPKICIPIHDGMLNPRQWIYGAPTKILGEAGIKFEALEPGTSIEL